jgi:hydrogenase-1 operon protein HyaF
MKSFHLPVRMIGPGSQVETEELQTLGMPRDMRTFEMPRVPDTVDAEALAMTRETLGQLLAAMSNWAPGQLPHPMLDLKGLTPAALKVTGEMLGDGEVSIQVNGTRALRIQESVFTGVWRVIELSDDGQIIADWVEAAPLPGAVMQAARDGSRPGLNPVEAIAGAMNSPALLRELQAQLLHRRPGESAHVLNLTLFPMTPEDHVVLERALPVGDVAVISRGFGNCRVTSTVVRDIWRVQYFNSMNTMILNTIEVVDVPEVALAAPEDLGDSRTRLAELIDWMAESCEA